MQVTLSILMSGLKLGVIAHEEWLLQVVSSGGKRQIAVSTGPFRGPNDGMVGRHALADGAIVLPDQRICTWGLPTSAWLLTDTPITAYPIAEFYYPDRSFFRGDGNVQRRLLFVPRGVFRTLLHPEKSVFP